MKKVVKNLFVGSLAVFTGVAVFNFVRRKLSKGNPEIENEELKREYIDLSDQLNKVKEEKEELEAEVEDVKEKVKEYTA